MAEYEHTEEKYDDCDKYDCKVDAREISLGKERRMNAFDYIRKELDRIELWCVSIEGSSPVYSMNDLRILLDNIQHHYENKDKEGDDKNG